MAGGPAFGQAQSSGVVDAGQATASSGGNTSTGNSSSNVASNQSTQTSPPTTSPPVLGSVLGLVLNLSTGSGNASNGTSTVNSGAAASSGNASDTSGSQTSAGGNNGGVGTVFSPFAAPAQSSGVNNAGAATATTGGNTGTGNNSTNVASNNQTVNAGLIGIGLQLGNTATNTSNGTSTINSGAATASGNQATTALDQTRLGDPRNGSFGIGGGVACDGFFRFGGQRVDVGNFGTANASTGNNASVGNQSRNIASNNSTADLGTISVDLPGGLTNTAANSSDGTSAITTGAATASGNRATTSVGQQCLQPLALASPPVITPGVIQIGVPPGRPGTVLVPGTPGQTQLARTGRDPFVMGLAAFALLFGGLMFLVWEKVEAYPKLGA